MRLPFERPHLKKKPRKKAVRKPRPKRGEELFNQVVALTGIDAKSIQRELKTICDRKGIDLNHLTLDQLRTVVASYLREIMGSLLDRYHPRRSDPTGN